MYIPYTISYKINIICQIFISYIKNLSYIIYIIYHTLHLKYQRRKMIYYVFKNISYVLCVRCQMLYVKKILLCIILSIVCCILHVIYHIICCSCQHCMNALLFVNIVKRQAANISEPISFQKGSVAAQRQLRAESEKTGKWQSSMFLQNDALFGHQVPSMQARLIFIIKFKAEICLK